MKRLTGRAPGGTAYLYNMGGINAAIDRLAAYEDTGLEPEELEYIARAKRGERMVTDEELKQAGVSQAEINALEEIAAVIAEGHPIALMPRWIPVTERLPENGVNVLCWYEYYHWSKEKILPEYGIGYCYNGHWGGEVSNGRDCKVLAWMPLPEPPKEVAKGDANG